MLFAQLGNQGSSQTGNAWLTAAIAVALAVIAVINLALGLYKQWRENKIGRAKFGYELIDAIFKNQEVLWLLDYMDSSDENLSTLRLALTLNKANLERERLKLMAALDMLLLYLDRVAHAVSADLTTVEVVRMPLAYYVRLLAVNKREVSAYIHETGFVRLQTLLPKFPEWTLAKAKS